MYKSSCWLSPGLPPGDPLTLRRRGMTARVVFGIVNPARRNYEQPTEALAKAEPSWLSQLISRGVPLSSWPDVLTRQPDDVKVTVDLRD